MQINISYDPSTADAPAGFFTAVNAAVAYLDTEFAAPITLNIAVGWGEVGGQFLENGDLGASSTTYVTLEFPNAVQALLRTDDSPATDASLLGLESSPSLGAASRLPYAQARLIGDAPVIPGVMDGYIGISSTAPFTFDPNNRAVAGEYDAIGAIEHEITEVMGRQTFDGHIQPDIGEANTYLDNFRYTAPGVHTDTPGPGYFSLNGDQLLLPFNDPSNGGDSGDWALGTSGDSFDAFGEPGVQESVSTVDLRVMELLGYRLAPAPATPNGAPTPPLPVTAALQVNSGQTLAFNGPFAITFEQSGAPSLTNAGSIIDTGTQSQTDVVGLTPDYANGVVGAMPAASFINAAGGVLQVEATAVAADAVGVYWGPTVSNSGTMMVTSDQADAWGVIGDPFTNTSTGKLQVQAADHAVGVNLSWSDGGAFSNAGTITVTGLDVIGVEGMTTFTNTGTLEAIGVGPGSTSMAIYATTPFDLSYTNSGTIEGDYSLYVSSNTGNEQGANMVLTNSGTMSGQIVLGDANDQIINTGSIVGAIHFGNGDSSYDGVGGTQSGGIYLGEGDNTVTLGADGEVVYGGGVSDAVTGGAGADFIEIFRGNNTIDGGGGFNTLSFADSDVGVTVDLGKGTATASGSDTLKNIQEVIGSNFNNTLIAGASAATLVAGSGHDTLVGGAGNDTLIAGAGGDSMTGGGGNNSFIYSAGDHQLVVTDFGAGGDQDALHIDGYASAQSTVQQGSNTLITLSSTDSILLDNVQASTLTGAEVVYSAAAYQPPAVPASPPVFGTTTIDFNTDLTVAAGEVLNEAGQSVGLLDLFGQNGDYHSLDNLGTIKVSGDDGDVSGFATQAIGSQLFTTGFTNAVGASLVVTDTDASGVAKGLDIPGSVPVTNAGSIDVSAVGDAYGLDTSGAIVLSNAATGVFEVTSADGVAYGLYVRNGADYIQGIVNDGSIQVTGAQAACGVKTDAAIEFPIVNNGDLTASTTGAGGQSVGIWVEGFAKGLVDPVAITNTGTITAQTAIESVLYASDVAISVVLTNSGVINGAIALGPGPNVITNTGSINGSIHFGDGDETYNGVGGSQSGGIYLGAGTGSVTLGNDGEAAYGGAGIDTITGGAGNDFIETGQGIDTIDGGGGFNTLSLADATAGVTINLGNGALAGGAAGAVKNIQAVIGSAFDDTMIAGAASVLFLAGSGHDTLTGAAGNDTLVAGAGGDTMTGGGGNNTFVFSAGDHQLIITDFDAGGDQDVLKIYGYAAAQSTVQQGADADIMLSNGDSIVLEGVQATSLTAANLVFSAQAYQPPISPPASSVFPIAGAPFQFTHDLTTAQDQRIDIVARTGDLAAGQNIGLDDGQEGLSAALFDNFGAITITSSDDGLLGLRAQSGQSADVSNEISGALTVSDTGGSATAVLLLTTDATFSDAGQITVTATGDATGVSGADEGDTFNLTQYGTMSVTSSAGAATGMVMDASASLENDGVLTVMGLGSAIGVLDVPVGKAATDGFSEGELTNFGFITATASAGPSYGIEVAAAYTVDGPSSIENLGTITAQTAIVDQDLGLGFVPLVVTNDGTINGAIDLGGGDSQLYNGGDINGAILLSTVTQSAPDALALGIYPPAIYNSGAIVGDITLAGSSASIRSDGSIAGDILLSDGSNIVDLRGGVFTGYISIAPTIAGQATDDAIFTGAAGALIKIHAGDSSLAVAVTGAAGGETILQFDIPSTQATETHNANGSWTVNAGTDGTETLTEVQTLEFTDRTVALGAPVANDFNGDGKSDLLIENTAGAVVVGEVAGGQATYATVSGLGPEWSFRGTGDFLGDGKADFLIENTAGAVAVGEVSGGQTSYTQVAGLGPEWSFRESVDFLGDGKSDFLIENSAGAVVVGEVVGGQAQYTQVAALGPEWTFVGAGDFLGEGHAQFLIENSSGTVVVGDAVGGQAAQYTAVAGLGSEWKFEGAGDFLGDGKADFLIENTAGAVYVGEVVGGQAQYTLVADLGPEWKFKGVGDYLGEGHDQFLIENTAGAVDIGDWTGGAIHYTQVAALGPEWAFH